MVRVHNADLPSSCKKHTSVAAACLQQGCSCNRAVLACLALSSSVIALYVLVPNVSRWVISHTERCKACKTSQLRCFVAENGAMANTDKYSMCKNALQAGRDTRSSVLDGHR